MTRLAARDIARHRSRTGPLVAAIVAVCGGALVAGTFYGASVARQQHAVSQVSQRLLTIWPNQSADNVRPDTVLADATSKVQAILAGSEVLNVNQNLQVPGDPLQRFQAGGTNQFAPIAVDPDQLTAYGFPEAGLVLTNGGAVVLTNDQTFTDRSVTIDRVKSSEMDAGTVVSSHVFPATVFAPSPSLPGYFDYSGCSPACRLWTVLVSFDQAAKLGADTSNSTVYVRADRPISGQQRNALNQMNSSVSQQTFMDDLESNRSPNQVASASVSTPPSLPPSDTKIGLIIAAAAVLLALAVTAIGIALGAVEQRDEDTALIAIGAGPSARRRLRSVTALLLSLIGAGVAVPLGYLTAAVVQHQTNPTSPLPFPTVVAAVLLVGLPLAAGAGGWLFTRTPRRVDLSQIT